MTAKLLAPTIAVVMLVSPGCSIKKFAVRQVGDALSSGPSVYETDSDIELVEGALPFGLKLVESLLAETPNHRGLLLTAARGFVLYSLAYVDFPAEVALDEDLDRGKAGRARAGRLYARALGYALRALDRRYPDYGDRLGQDPEAAAAQVTAGDIDLLYWASAALGLAIGIDPTDPEMVVRLPEVEAMIDRALELDEAWDEGSLHEIRLALDAAKPGGGDPASIEESYERALALSAGKRAGLYLSYAEAVAVPAQDRALFETMIAKALAVDADKYENCRLVNALAQRRARWLQSRIDDLFF